ncbi:MAG TPA: ribonuclease H-like domain-containing protein [Candidatus Sulfotelmatobacter sp.]|nr:ribonuclease H-like domain-containing protein [Candidatus Sulfotelmatobacter sp.]
MRESMLAAGNGRSPESDPRPVGGRARAYLDIETAFEGGISIIGIYGADRGMIQLVGGDVTDVGLVRALDGVETLCTYNGDRFDLPVIRRRLGVDLREVCRPHDLMRDCWRVGLKGGLKRVEAQIGIVRQTQGVDGYAAMRLWANYTNDGDADALQTLLLYNREDVLNLALLDAYLEPYRNRHADARRL